MRLVKGDGRLSELKCKAQVKSSQNWKGCKVGGGSCRGWEGKFKEPDMSGPRLDQWGGVGCQRRGWEGVGPGLSGCQGWRAGMPSGCPEGFGRGSARAVTPGIGLAGLAEDWGGAQVDKAGGSGGAPV